MGRLTRAGFKTASGEKVQGESYVYSVDDVLGEVRRQGVWEVLGVRERGVEDGDLVDGRVGERGRKWVGVNVWFGVVVRKRADHSA